MFPFYGNEAGLYTAYLAVSPQSIDGLTVIDLRQAFFPSFPLYCGQPPGESKADLNSVAAAALCCSLEIRASLSLCYSSMHFIVLEKPASICPSDNHTFMVQRISNASDAFLKLLPYIICHSYLLRLLLVYRSDGNATTWLSVTISEHYCIFSALPEGTPIKYILTIIMAAAQGRSLPSVSLSPTTSSMYFLIVPLPSLPGVLWAAAGGRYSLPWALG